MNKSRSGNVELARFIAALMIMIFHQHYIYIPDRSCLDAWIYVEFFLIITGYYTAKHFDNANHINPMKESIIYSLKKFIPFFPYVFFTSLLAYLSALIPRLVLNEIEIKDVLYSLCNDWIFEAFLVIESFEYPYLGTLWFFSVLFIVFPLFSWLMQVHNRYWIITVCSMYSLLYYGVMGVNTDRVYPNDFFRVIAGLCLGAFVYEMVYAFSNYIYKINKVILTLIEAVTFLLPLVIIFTNFGSTRFILLCFVVCLSIMLPNLSYSDILKGKVFVFLGRLSIPLCIIHQYFGDIIIRLSGKMMISNKNILVLYYGGSIIFSLMAMWIVDHWKWFQCFVMKSISLKD